MASCVFDAQVQLAAVSPQIPSVERKEVEVCDGIVSFYGKLLLKAKGLWQTVFDVSQDRDDKAGWKDIRETKTVSSGDHICSYLESPSAFHWDFPKDEAAVGSRGCQSSARG